MGGSRQRLYCTYCNETSSKHHFRSGRWRRRRPLGSSASCDTGREVYRRTQSTELKIMSLANEEARASEQVGAELGVESIGKRFEETMQKSMQSHSVPTVRQLARSREVGQRAPKRSARMAPPPPPLATRRRQIS